MGILFFTYWYPSKESPYNGIFIKEHASSISNKDNEVIILAINIFKGSKIFEKKIEVLINEDGIQTHIIHLKSSIYKWIYSIPLITYWITKKYTYKNIKPNLKIDLVHSNILFPCAVVGDRLSRKLKAKHIITEHWSGIEKFITNHPFGYLGRKALKNASKISVVSHFLKSKITCFINDSKKISIIPNIIDTTIFNYSLKNETDNLVFTAVGSWKSPKQPHLFIESLNNIQKRKSQKIELNIIGEGPLLTHFKDHQELYSIQINFLGIRNKNEISEILKLTDFFVHASLIETFSVVIAEALVSGVPVIASNTGAIPELVQLDYGFICENSIEKWEESIEKALNTKFDRLKISTENSEKFNKNKVGKMFQEIYNSL